MLDETEDVWAEWSYAEEDGYSDSDDEDFMMELPPFKENTRSLVDSGRARRGEQRLKYGFLFIQEPAVVTS